MESQTVPAALTQLWVVLRSWAAKLWGNTDQVSQMTPVRLADLDCGIDSPELFFGVVAAVGTPWTTVEPYLRGGLTNRGYTVDPVIRVSELLRLFMLEIGYSPDTADEYE